MQWGWLAWHWTIAIAVRMVFLALGLGDAMLWRPEVSTPANTLLKAREGVWLLQMGMSPYRGSACHLPPLWLAVTAPWSQHKVLYAVPNMVCDVVAAAAVMLAAASLYRSPGPAKKDAPWLSPEQLSLLYLLNPFTILTCVAGSSTSAENMGVVLAVAGGVMCNAPMAAAGVAIGTYMGLHPILLMLPLLLLMWRGPEDVLQHVPPPVPGLLLPSRKTRIKEGEAANITNDDERHGIGSTAADGGLSDEGPPEAAASSSGLTAAASKVRQRRKQAQPAAAPAEQNGASAAQLEQHTCKVQQQQAGAVVGLTAGRQQRSCALCGLFVAVLLLSSAGLLLLSDSMMQPHPETQCVPALMQFARQALSFGSHTHPRQAQLNSCWAVRVYKFSLLLEDYTPTIGLWWYFFTEMFDAFRPFFLFVFHSFAVILALPVAVRFANRPLFVTWVQLFITCMFKPYACVGDMVPWMSLLPLLQQQLQCIKLGLFFVNSLLLLMVLGPAMWHQWIVMDAANANFFYSITLLLGVWYTVFLVHMMSLTALLDRRLSLKPVVLHADELLNNKPAAAVSQPSAPDAATAAAGSRQLV